MSPSEDQDYVVLPLYFSWRFPRLPAIWTVGFFIVAAAIYVSWPSDPGVKIVRMRITSLRVRKRPHVEVDVSFSLTVEVRNDDVYWMDYTGLDVVVGYRGRRLGHVRSDGGHVRARGTSYVDAELDLERIGIFSDVVFLIEDLARGTVRLDTLTAINGQLGLLFLHFPIQAKVYCEISINTNTINQTFLRHNCYPSEKFNSELQHSKELYQVGQSKYISY